MKKYFLLLALSICYTGYAQSSKALTRKGNKKVNKENYITAIPFFEEALAKDSSNYKAMFQLGVCYLNRYNKVKGLNLIEKSINKAGTDVDKYADYWHARALHVNYRFDEAIVLYEKYKSTIKKTKDERRLEVIRNIQQCKDAPILLAESGDFDVVNLGDQVNSEYSEHSPVVSEDDQILMFTSRKSPLEGGKVTSNGEYWEDIYVSTKQNEGWSKAKPADIVLNTKGHDAVTQIFGPNNNQMLLYRSTSNGDLYYTRKINNEWSKPAKIKGINSGSFESSAFLSKDGKKIYFSTNDFSKNGDLDFYYSELSSDSTWSKPKNFSTVLNTPYDEDALVFTEDEKTIYFSSRGHNGMGGFDIFKSKYDESTQSWSKPENLGFPINTPDEDVYYYLSKNGKKGYLSSYRDGGLGEKDIYGVTPIPNVIASGIVYDKISKTIVSDPLVTVTLKPTDVKSNKKTVSSQLTDGTFEHTLRAKRTYDVYFTRNNNDTIDHQQYIIPMTDSDSVVFSKEFYIPYYKDSAQALAANKIDSVVTNPVVETTPKKDKTIKETPKAAIIDPNDEINRIITTYGTVYFETNQFQLDADDKAQLKEVTAMVRKYKSAKILISGYTDDTGPAEFNLKLSKLRAKSVINYLLQNGADSKRIRYQFFGSENPANPHQQKGVADPKNRRVEIRVDK